MPALGFSIASREPTNAAEGNEGPLAAQAESIAASATATARSTMESKTLIIPPHSGAYGSDLSPTLDAVQNRNETYGPLIRSVL